MRVKEKRSLGMGLPLNLVIDVEVLEVGNTVLIFDLYTCSFVEWPVWLSVQVRSGPQVAKAHIGR